MSTYTWTDAFIDLLIYLPLCVLFWFIVAVLFNAAGGQYDLRRRVRDLIRRLGQ